jgi:hypothetical protein
VGQRVPIGRDEPEYDDVAFFQCVKCRHVHTAAIPPKPPTT